LNESEARNGARLVIFPPHAPSLAELGGFIQKRNITTLWLTAGLFNQMIEEQVEALGGVRQLLAGGDVLSVSAVNRALVELPDCQFINGYGPTENTNISTEYVLVEIGEQDQRTIPIGYPVANTEAIILTEDRDKFSHHLSTINIPTPRSHATGSLNEALKIAKEIGFPVMIRAGFALGGHGSGVAYDETELKKLFGYLENAY